MAYLGKSLDEKGPFDTPDPDRLVMIRTLIVSVNFITLFLLWPIPIGLGRGGGPALF